MFSKGLKTTLYTLLLGALVGFLAQPVVGQESLQSVTRPRTVSKATSLRTIPSGQEITITGNVTRVEKDSFRVCDLAGAETVVLTSDSLKITTHRRGIFRGAEVRDSSAFLLGLRVQVRGRGNDAGQLVAKWVKFHDSDFRAQTQVDTRAIPIEIEQERIAGELEETTAVATVARKDARLAQESADKARGTADLARTEASAAQNTAIAAHSKIAAIDDYQATDALTVNFKVGSAALTRDAKAKLDEFAAKTITAKGYILEISAYADTSGGEQFNHGLTQRRAESVMDYFVGVCKVPVRRIVVPYSAGEMNPVADNRTREGRALNRRAEVKMLVSEALAAKEQVARSNQ
ncbi:MAG TPA: OmpA family protein [Blastocatellia bacterium]|nr:OmpA family protein [Blastocatellia bacterium]